MQKRSLVYDTAGLLDLPTELLQLIWSNILYHDTLREQSLAYAKAARSARALHCCCRLLSVATAKTDTNCYKTWQEINIRLKKESIPKSMGWPAHCREAQSFTTQRCLEERSQQVARKFENNFSNSLTNYVKLQDVDLVQTSHAQAWGASVVYTGIENTKTGRHSVYCVLDIEQNKYNAVALHVAEWKPVQLSSSGDGSGIVCILESTISGRRKLICWLPTLNHFELLSYKKRSKKLPVLLKDAWCDADDNGFLEVTSVWQDMQNNDFEICEYRIRGKNSTTTIPHKISKIASKLCFCRPTQSGNILASIEELSSPLDLSKRQRICVRYKDQGWAGTLVYSSTASSSVRMWACASPSGTGIASCTEKTIVIHEQTVPRSQHADATFHVLDVHAVEVDNFAFAWSPCGLYYVFSTDRKIFVAGFQNQNYTRIVARVIESPSCIYWSPRTFSLVVGDRKKRMVMAHLRMQDSQE